MAKKLRKRDGRKRRWCRPNLMRLSSLKTIRDLVKTPVDLRIMDVTCTKEVERIASANDKIRTKCYAFTYLYWGAIIVKACDIQNINCTKPGIYLASLPSIGFDIL